MKNKNGFAVITGSLQRAFERKAKENNMPDDTPVICGLYGRACRQMDDPEGANRALCEGCPLAKYFG